MRSDFVLAREISFSGLRKVLSFPNRQGISEEHGSVLSGRVIVDGPSNDPFWLVSIYKPVTFVSTSMTLAMYCYASSFDGPPKALTIFLIGTNF